MISIAPFIEAVHKFINVCLVLDHRIFVGTEFVGNLALTFVNNGLQSIIYCIQIANFLYVCLNHRGRLICVKLVKMPKQKLVRHFQLTVLCTLIKHAPSTNQSARYIETYSSKLMEQENQPKK